MLPTLLILSLVVVFTALVGIAFGSAARGTAWLLAAAFLLVAAMGFAFSSVALS